MKTGQSSSDWNTVAYEPVKLFIFKPPVNYRPSSEFSLGKPVMPTLALGMQALRTITIVGVFSLKIFRSLNVVMPHISSFDPFHPHRFDGGIFS